MPSEQPSGTGSRGASGGSAGAPDAGAGDSGDTPTVLPYIDLGTDAPEEWSRWSNDPNKMKIRIYFSLDPNAPGLAETYNLPGLKPMLVKQEEDGRGDKFLLRDDTNSFFLYDEETNELCRFMKPMRIPQLIEKVRTDSIDNGDLAVQYYVEPRPRE